MKWLKRLLWGGLFLLIVIVAFTFCLPYLNDYQSEGKLLLAGLKKPVTIKRDEKGMAFIYAKNMHDAIMAQGRLCELVGDKAINEHTRSTLVLDPK